jgi:hypothetical protein
LGAFSALSLSHLDLKGRGFEDIAMRVLSFTGLPGFVSGMMLCCGRMPNTCSDGILPFIAWCMGMTMTCWSAEDDVDLTWDSSASGLGHHPSSLFSIMLTLFCCGFWIFLGIIDYHVEGVF